MSEPEQDLSAKGSLAKRVEPVPGVDWAGPTWEEVAALRQHPRFVEAMTATMQVPIDLYRGNRILNLITNDRGRYILTIFALHLHYSRRPQDPGSGLTATRLQTMCAEQGVCSFGRAGALIRLLRWSGYLADAPATADKRVRLLMPTERMFEFHRERWQRQLRAIALVRPEAQEALAQFDHPAFHPAFTAGQVSEFVGGFRFYRYAPDIRTFVERNAGLFILFSIALARTAGDTIPPVRPVPVSASALAKRFHVSRSHVIGMLREAVEAGLLERPGPGNEYRMTPRLREATETMIATLHLFTAASARAALAAVARASEAA
jgi:DNA-binding MarR family transcriptional regulator